ncbi:hypothetical protein [Chitinophaga vietnamensis]|uniref:hypothetical protein n=1 Tax=Chitinophaga vietnamensis TaxID=2593957 RepID=UPI0011773AF5|nr:hypothetical protein [Chitinophaga vietnamensis]
MRLYSNPAPISPAGKLLLLLLSAACFACKNSKQDNFAQTILISPQTMVKTMEDTAARLPLPADSGKLDSYSRPPLRAEVRNTGEQEDAIAYSLRVFNGNKQVFYKKCFFSAGKMCLFNNRYFSVQLKKDVAETAATGVLYLVDMEKGKAVAVDSMTNGTNAPMFNIDNKVILLYVNDNLELCAYNVRSHTTKKIAKIIPRDMEEEELDVIDLDLTQNNHQLSGKLFIHYEDEPYYVPVSIAVN